MNNLSILFEIYKYNEISVISRINLLKSFGKAINDTLGMNVTEPIIYELVKNLDANNKLLNDSHYYNLWRKNNE